MQAQYGTTAQPCTTEAKLPSGILERQRFADGVDFALNEVSKSAEDVLSVAA